MEALKFTISGEFAFFKNADLRSGIHFTYNHIHRLTILGILGAVIGLEGYNTHHLRKVLKKNPTFFPEFYERLKGLEMSIVPNSEFNHFPKQMHHFTETTTFANEDGTLMVQEQWLRNPSWDIYILLNQSIELELEEKLIDYLLSNKAVYIPYLGKNDHPARISSVSVVDLEEQKEEVKQIHSLVLLTEQLEQEILEQQDEINYFLFEFLPESLDEQMGNYVFRKMAYTDAFIIQPAYYDASAERYLCFM